MTIVHRSRGQQFYKYDGSDGWPAAEDRHVLSPYPRSGDDEQNPFDRPSDAAQSVHDLIRLYRASASYRALSDSAKGSYDLYLSRIAQKFGSFPILAFDQKGARTAIRRWRDDILSERPRTADATIGVVRRLFNFAVEEEYLARNPAALLGRIHTATRRDIIWSDSQIAAFLAKAPRHLARVLLLAVWTGQRQGDLLSLEWKSYDGEYIRLQQRKASSGAPGRRVKVLVANELRTVLAEIEEEQVARSQHADRKKRVPRPDVILTTSRGNPWGKGFRCTWRKAVADAGISGVTFHDLRGTFITLSHRAGATIREISEASGHDERTCERVIRQHYLATGAELVISRLEASRSFAGEAWIAVGSQSARRTDARARFTGPRRPRLSARVEHASGTS